MNHSGLKPVIKPMKNTFLICCAAFPVIATADVCKGLDEPEIKEVIAAARELAEFVEDDKKFAAIKEMSTVDQRAANAQAAMQPIDFTEEKHRIDQYALGDLLIESNIQGGTQRLQGSAYKISRSCIVTAAHVLYPTTNQEMSAENKTAYNGKIKFVRGSATEKMETSASVFFQMTKKDDFIIDGEKRHFKGNSDIVVLRLNNYQDNYFKKIKVVSPKQLLIDVDPKVGRKITCMGSPSHMTQKSYGACNGTDFKWKQENARIFSKDITTLEFGVLTNSAFSPGMSGGVCFLAEDVNQVVGLAVNGFIVDRDGKLVMPNINLESTDSVNKYVRHIATFNKLNERMKSELGYGINDLDKHCK